MTVSRLKTFLNIRVYQNNVIVWMIPILPQISDSSSPFYRLLGIVLNAPTTIDITLTLIFESFFHFSGKVQVFIYLFAFFYFDFVVGQNPKIHKMANSHFLLINNSVKLLAGIR